MAAAVSNLIRSMAVFLFVALYSAAAASAQDIDVMAPAPAPARMDNGGAFSLPIPGAAVYGSVLLSLIALIMKH